MASVNKFSPQDPPTETLRGKPHSIDQHEDEHKYDVNFCFHVRDLENNRVRLAPFIPELHAEAFFAGTVSNPEIYQHLPFGPFETVADFVHNLVEKRIRRDPAAVLFAVLDKTYNNGENTESENQIEDIKTEARLAGIFGLLNASPINLSIELGFAITLPAYQRTHVTSNAIGLLLQYCLDLPPAGLGLRRVQWQANSTNRASIQAAERMGFVLEGVLRWERLLSEGKQGKIFNRPGIDGETVEPPCARTPGRDTAMLAICWDDWVEKRDAILRVMQRHN